MAHNKSNRRRTRGSTSQKWKLNSRRSVMTSSLSRTRTSSHRPEGLQEPKAINKGRPRGRREATGSIASQERHESCEAECIEEYTAQRKVVAWEEQQKLVKKSGRTKQRP